MSEFDFDVTIRVGESVRSFPVASIAAVFRVSVRDARTALAMLLYGTSVPVDSFVTSKKTGPLVAESAPSCKNFSGGKLRPSDRPNRTEPTDRPEPTGDSISSPVPTGRRDGGLGEGNQPSRLDARVLALTLGDPDGIASLERLVAAHPAHMIAEALRQTLAVPADRIRKSRAALFTAIVRRLTNAECARSAPPSKSPTN